MVFYILLHDYDVYFTGFPCYAVSDYSYYTVVLLTTLGDAIWDRTLIGTVSEKNHFLL